MERRRAATFRGDGYGDTEDADEIGVFAAERYFNGEDDAPWWCGRSSSSLSSAFRTGTQGTGRSGPLMTAATSSSEASWNSRSALLPDGDEQVLAAAAAALHGEAKTSGATSDECRAGPGRRPSPPSHIRRWLLGAAVCACGPGAAEEWASTDDDDEVEAGNGKALLVGSKERATESGELCQRTESKELAFEAPPAARLRPGGRHDDGDDAFLARRAAAAPVQLRRHGQRQAGNSGELPMPVLTPATTATFDDYEQQRRRSFDMFRPLGDRGGALVSAKPNSAFTIVAGNTARSGAPGAAVAGGRDPREEDDAAPSEVDGAYPPSEASVVWSVATAEGAASGIFSSAASGCYHYYIDDGEREALRRSAMKANRRRSGITGSGGGLLTCMSDKAVEAVGPSRSVQRTEVAPAAAARLGAAAGSRNGLARGYSDVKRRR